MDLEYQRFYFERRYESNGGFGFKTDILTRQEALEELADKGLKDFKKKRILYNHLLNLEINKADYDENKQELKLNLKMLT